MKRLILLLAVAGVGCVTKMAFPDHAEASQGARVVVTAQSRIAHAPAYFKPIARVYDPKQELQCPTFEWDYGDGCISKNEPYCDPFEDTENRRQRWVIQPLKYHLYSAPGEYLIAFKVVAGDRTLRDSITVLVQGATLDDK